jgi:flagellar basal body-associated protein FliL
MYMDQAVDQTPARPDGFPKNPDGTIDWEVVFEAPDTGFLTLVQQARSLDGLSACTRVIVDQLFTRKNDEPERTRLYQELEALIARSETVEAARDSIVRLLRAIKQERLLKAAAYTANRSQRKFKRKGGAEERRDDEVLHQMFSVKKPLVAAIVGLWILASAVIGVGLFLMDGDETETVAETRTAPAATPAVTPAAEPPAPAADPSPVPKKPAPEKPKVVKKPVKAVPEYPKIIHMRPMFHTIGATRVQKGYTYYQAALVVENREAYSAVCTRLPSVRDVINTALSQALPKQGLANGRELAAAGAWAVSRFAAKFGPGVVARVDFLADGDSNFRARAIPCR